MGMRNLVVVGLLALFILVPTGAALAQEASILAVMEMEDSSRKLKRSDVQAATECLRGLLAQAARFEIVDKGRQEEKRKTVIDKLRLESGDACYDERCRVQLGRELAADTLLACTIRVLGSQCTLTCELIPLEKATADNAGVARFRCGADGLAGAVESVAAQLGEAGASPTATAEDEEPVAVGSGPGKEYLVTFESDPPGALLEVGGVARGQTPYPLYLKVGKVKVRMTLTSYETREGTVPVSSNSTTRWKLKPAVGWLDAETEPSGLAVRVLKGSRVVKEVSAPISNLELDPGNYVVETADDSYYTAREAVRIDKGRRAAIKLAPKARTGWLKVKAFDKDGRAVAAKVWAGKELLGAVPGPWQLQVGSYQLQLQAKGFDLGREETQIEAGKTTTEKVTLAREKTVAPQKVPASSRGKGGINWVYSKPAGLYFAKSETTLSQYEACVKAGQCDAKHHKTKSNGKYCNWGHSGRGDHPMNCVSWYGAQEFCEWAGGRLPTEDEWYSEASNSGRREYAWGDEEVTCRRAVWGYGSRTDGCGKDRTWPVCSKSAGNSVSGLCDVTGNVWEWTSSWYDSDRDKRVLRGGSWVNHPPEYLRASTRPGDDPDYRYSSSGFRCVRSSQ